MKYRQYNALKKSMKLILASPLRQDIQKIILYGSCARNQEQFSSDVDLAVILNNKPKQYYSKNVRELRNLILGTIFRTDECSDVDVHFYTDETLEQSQLHYFKNIRKEGKTIWTCTHTKISQKTITNI